MILINFSHAMTAEQIRQVEEMMKRGPVQLVDIPCQMDLDKPLAPQVRKVYEQSLPYLIGDRSTILVHLPGLSTVAVLLMEHMRVGLGYRPFIVIMRRNSISPVGAFDVVEIL
jgi:hypothetical protein